MRVSSLKCWLWGDKISDPSLRVQEAKAIIANSLQLKRKAGLCDSGSEAFWSSISERYNVTSEEFQELKLGVHPKKALMATGGPKHPFVAVIFQGLSDLQNF